MIEQQFLPRILRYYDEGDRYGFWAAEERASGAFLGWFHLRPHVDSPPDEPELGYRLRRDAWGQGYATEGAQALVDRAFRDYGARRVVASTYQENRGSRRVMEKVGMTFVRAFHYAPPEECPDEVVWEGDDVEYAITREEWVRHRGGGEEGAR